MRPESYFNKRAKSYAVQIEGDPFLQYFHRQRLEAALPEHYLEGKRVLDIGAGTGILYDFFQEKGIETDYYACDIAAEMLANSSIPEARRFHGTAPEHFADAAPFDAIFLIGLSTYLEPRECSELLRFAAGKLTPDGCLVVTFTHRKSLDFKLRHVLRKWLPGLLPRKGIIGSGLSINAYDLKETEALIPDLNTEKVEWLNQTLPFFNRLFPRLAVALAKLRKKLLPASLIPFFSSDFLIIWRQ